mgnify:CR=1 FL=1
MAKKDNAEGGNKPQPKGDKAQPKVPRAEKAAKVEKGSQTPSKAVAGSVTMAQLKEIAGIKMKDLNCYDEPAAMKIIEGSARSMGLEVQ